MPSVLRMRLLRLPSSRNHFTPYDIWVQNLTAYFYKIYNNSNGLSKVTVTITVLIIVYLTFNFHFFISSDLDKTFKYCILHYLNKLLMVFMKFKENKTTVLLDGILRFPKSMNQIWHDLRQIESSRFEGRFGVLNSSHFGLLMSAARKCYPVGDLRWMGQTGCRYLTYPEELANKTNTRK